MMNLFNIVSGVTASLHTPKACTLYQSKGQKVLADGSIKAIYSEGIPVLAEFQSLGINELYHSDRLGSEETSRRIYLKSTNTQDKKISGILRELGRNGDMLVDEDKSTWLIEAVLEDFSRAGWMSVRASLQLLGPDLSFSESE